MTTGEQPRLEGLRLAAVNVGNSTAAAALLDNGAVVERLLAAARDRAAVAGLCRRVREIAAAGVPVAAASVNAPLLERLEEAAALRFSVAGRDFPIPVRNLCRHPQRTGHDRLLAALAAGACFGLPAIALDFGTALTFNAVGESGAFLGGAIVPGLSLAARSLAEACVQLPLVALRTEPAAVGRDTEEAIASGLLNGYAGLAGHLIDRIENEIGAPCRVVATGGDAALILARIPRIQHHDPDLVLKGLAMAYGCAGCR